MGLYQYIREQEHRGDLVGELGRWMLENPEDRPDHESDAFKLAVNEFEACGEWTRKDAVERLNQNEQFQRIIKIEPHISPIISEAIQLKTNKGYNRAKEYVQLKKKIIPLVGFESGNEKIGDSESYNTVIQALADIIPPDAADLYPEGLENYKRYNLDV